MRIKLYSFIEVGCAPLILIVTTPLFVSKLGPEAYSAVAAMQALAAIGSIASVGITTATMKRTAEGELTSIELAKQYARNVNSLLNGIAYLVVILAASAWLIATYLQLKSPALTSTSFFAALFLFLATQYDQYFAGCLKGLGRYQEVATGEALGRAPIYLGSAFIAKDLGATGVCISIAIAPLMSAGIKSLLLRYRFGAGWIDGSVQLWNADKDLLKFSMWSWIQNVCLIGSGALDRIIIGSYSGLAIMTYYSATLQISQAIHTGTNAAIQPYLPQLTRLVKSNNALELRRAIFKYLAGALGIVVALSIIVVFYLWWQSTRLFSGISEADKYAPYVLVASVSILSLNVVAYYSLIALDSVHLASITNCVASVIFLMLIFVASPGGLAEVSWIRVSYGLITLALFPILYIALRSHARRSI